MADDRGALWPLRCAFCAITEHEADDAAIFVQGPFVCICADCVATCNEVIDTRRAFAQEPHPYA